MSNIAWFMSMILFSCNFSSQQMLGPDEHAIRVRPISSELSILSNCDGSARVKQGTLEFVEFGSNLGIGLNLLTSGHIIFIIYFMLL